MIRQFAILAILLGLFSGLSGQKILDFDKFSIDDGFTSSKANVFLQDSKGFLWIGTWNGLNRYDGYEVETFRPTYHDTSSISNREVLSLIEDRNGYIWVGTTSGLNRYDPRFKEWKRYDFQSRIMSLLEDREGYIWIGTWNGGLFRLDPATGSMQHFLENEIVSDIYEDSRNNLWIATYFGLVNFDRSTFSYVRYLPDRNQVSTSLGHTIVTQIAESDKGTLWVGTWGGGLQKVEVKPDRDSVRFTHYKVRDGKGSISSNAVFRLHYDDYGNLWIGTWDGGLNLLERSEQDNPPELAEFSSYQNDQRSAYGISGNNISAIYVDRSGLLWVGSSLIERTSIVDTGIRQYQTHKTVEGKYTERNMRSLLKKDSLLWVGSTSDIILYQESEGKLSQVLDIPPPEYQYKSAYFLSSSALSLIYNDDGLWVGTEDAGIVLYRGNSALKQGSSYEFYNTLTDPAIPGNKVSELYQSKKYPGVIWIGTLQNGFAKLTYTEGVAEVEDFDVGNTDNALSDNNIRALLEDRDGLVWIGTQNGLNCFDPETRIFHKYFYEFSDTSSINDNVINVLYEDHAGNLWVGTNAGLNKKIQAGNGKDEIRFKGFPGLENLGDELITNILEDNNGDLWIGLYRGMIEMDTESETILNEYFSKEYQHLIIERNSAIKDEEGIFYFGGGNGFMAFNPDSLLRNTHPPEACITDLIIFNQSIEYNMLKDKKGSEPFTALPYRYQLKIPYNSKILTFKFSSMDFKDPKRNSYSYMLEGFEKQWNEVGSRNSATYTNLRPGKYVFKVQAANSDGIWSEKPAFMGLTIATPWWQTKVAMVIYILILLGLLYFFKQYSIIGVKEKSRIMIDNIQYEKERELNEEKSLFFTNITHEFRTPLTLITGPAEELLKTSELSGYAKKQAALIQRNAQRMLRLVNQFMEFRKVEKGMMEVYLQMTDIGPLLNDLYDSFRGMAKSKNIEFTVTSDKKQLMAMLDMEKFEKVIFNLVSNAFKFSEEGSKITIHAGIDDRKSEKPYLVVEVEDTGIGISAENREKVFERFFQVNRSLPQSTGGIGLYLADTFVRMHGGTIELESEPGQGSCFRVMIPVQGVKIPPGEKGLKLETEKIVQEQFPQAEVTNTAVRLSNEGTGEIKQLVLIVEDDSELNDFMVEGLSGDFNVLGCYNGKEGLENAKKLSPDIIITDIMMPVMDGMEMSKLLRQDLSTSHIPVVFLTAKTMREDELKGLKIGAVDYIYKPFNLDSLRLKIQNLLDNKKKIQQRIKANQILEPEYIELSSLDEKFLNDAVEAVNKNLDDPSFDVEKFSYEIGISPNQAYRKIKALTGQTAKEFIRNQRLKTSAMMLLQKKRSISEIIYMVGFSSPSYFTRCFKEYHGCTPKEYIEKNSKV